MGGFATQGIYLDQYTQVSQEFRNAEYAAQQIFPRVPVSQPSGKIARFGFERFHRYNTTRPPGGEAREMIKSNVVNDAYLTEPHHIKKLITDYERKAAASQIQIEVTVTNELNDVLWLDIEFAAYNLITTTGAIPQTTLSGVNQWSDYVNSDPIAAVEAQKRSIFTGATREPNCFACGYDVYVKLRQHPKIVDRYKYTAPTGVVSTQQLASAFGVDNFIVLKALYDASTNQSKGIFGSVNASTSPLDFVWVKNAFLFFRPDEPALLTPSFGYSFWWSDQSAGGGPAIFRYRWEIREGEFLEARSNYDFRVLRPQAMYLFLAAVA